MNSRTSSGEKNVPTTFILAALVPLPDPCFVEMRVFDGFGGWPAGRIPLGQTSFLAETVTGVNRAVLRLDDRRIMTTAGARFHVRFTVALKVAGPFPAPSF